MKILQLTNKLPFPPKDGGALATLNMTRGLIHYGHNITILAMNTSKHFYDPNLINSKITEGIDLITIPVNTKITFTAALKNLFFSSIPYNIQRFITNDYKKALIKLLNKDKYDIIQLEGLSLCPYIPTIREFSKAKIVLRAHNVESLLWKRICYMKKPGIRKIYIKILSRRLQKFEVNCINMIDALVPITENDKNYFIKMGCKKPVHVASAGIQLAKNQNAIYKKVISPSLFFIGALDWLPNQEGLLWFINKVWNEIIKKHPGIKFFIAGRNSPEYFKKKIRKKGIVFKGEVDSAENFIRDKAILIVPLFSGSGIRVKILEGMSQGKVVISTPAGAEGIGVENGKHIFIAESPDDFISAVNKIIENKHLYEKIGKAAINFVNENFNNLAIIKTLLSFYNSLKT